MTGAGAGRLSPFLSATMLVPAVLSCGKCRSLFAQTSPSPSLGLGVEWNQGPLNCTALKLNFFALLFDFTVTWACARLHCIWTSSGAILDFLPKVINPIMCLHGVDGTLEFKLGKSYRLS